MKYYIGIDGGGSKTLGVLYDENGNALQRHTVGSTNPNDIGIDESKKRLASLAAELLSKVSCPGDRAYAVYAGVSGAIGNERELSEALSAFSEKVRVGSDASLLIALAGDGGACLISGTGSVLFAKRGEELHRVGGWGYLIDGKGGGYDIGRDAISAALMMYDGRGRFTSLLGRLSDRFGCPLALAIPEIYSGGKAYIASFCPIVFEEAEKGDEVSLEILSENADYLSSLLLRCREILGEGVTVVAGGSLLTKSNMFFGKLKERCPDGIILKRSEHEPVYGAFLEAKKL